jgi:hypothetical protein
VSHVHGSAHRRLIAIAVLAGATALAAACGPAPASVRVPVATIPQLATSTPAPGASGPAVASATPEPTGPPAIVVDPSLLELLPADIAGVRLQPDTDTAAEIATDPALAAALQSIAVAAAFGPQATDTLTDYAVATVVRLRPGVFDDGWFRDWRDSFDEGVCAQAGGVTGHAEATMDGRPVFIGTCAGDVHTWHVYLPREGVVVSTQGIGDGRFGERIIDGITP